MNAIRSLCIGVFRLTRVFLHLGEGAATLLLAYPCCGQAVRLRLKRRWSRRLLDLFGVELLAHGLPQGGLRVANHVSWLDVFVINAVAPCAFVAKREVRGWPLIGWLCARTDTLFIDRESRRAAHAAAQRMAALLAAGRELVVFPEGTTSDGRAVLPFRGALLQAAIDADVAVQPLALRYESASGTHADAPVYCGDTSLLASLWRVATAGGLHARLVLLPACHAGGRTRQAFADALRADIALALHVALAGQAAAPEEAVGLRELAAQTNA
jgi:1-acyl-sn-glycerol-3-phosphate acyltransferase